ncbi:hypothetical protein F4604DRAFT_1685781 [Suillus subluteus]|nr:hypothetical protein F4604DRAFT_1685781 [Suillus subluteus]
MSVAKGERTLITKTVNVIMGKQEMSYQQVMSYLVGGGDYYTSHVFHTFKWYEFVNGMQRWEDSVLAFEEQSDNAAEEDLDNAQSDEQVTVSIFEDKLEISRNVQDYTLRPFDVHFDQLCLWEFVECTVKEKGDINVPNDASMENEAESDIDDIPSKKKGRAILPRAKFAQGHSQVAMHILRLRKKFVVPDAYEKETFPAKLLVIIKNMNVENECKDARDAHAVMVQEQHHKPHPFGAQYSEETQVDMDAFDEALFADATLDGEDVESSAQENEPDSIVTDPNVRDIQHCLRAGLDSGLFVIAGGSRSEQAISKGMDTYLVSDNKQGRLPEFATFMRAAKKRKRPVDVGSSDAEVK